MIFVNKYIGNSIKDLYEEYIHRHEYMGVFMMTNGHSNILEP